MATYKLIQDIEAEDKILGPLSLRQFIYGLISALFFYISFLVLTKGAGILLILFLPPALFTGFFAFPFGGDQPTEVWALAKIRFLFKPRRRLWDQSGVKELVTINVPKKEARSLTNGLSDNEVQSRLKALANTIDSRGWAVKNINTNMYGQLGTIDDLGSDRLVGASSIPREVPGYDTHPSDDILDVVSNPIAQKFDTMITDSSRAKHQQLIDQMNAPSAPQQAAQAPVTVSAEQNNYWFLNQATLPQNLSKDKAVFSSTELIHPDQAVFEANKRAEDKALQERLNAQNYTDNAEFTNMRVLQPLVTLPIAHKPTVDTPPTESTATPVTMATPPNPAIITLSHNNDLNVSTLAREADKAKKPNGVGDNEVVVSLH